MKNLICAKDVEALEKQGQKVCYIDDNTIVTPSAKDAARSCGIQFSTAAPATIGNCPGVENAQTAQPAIPQPIVQTTTGLSGGNAGQTKAGEGTIDSEMIYNVLKSLMEKGLLQGMFDSCTSESGLPYTAERDAGGLKLIRGNTVKMDVFETGDPNAKAYYQELISKDDAKISAGFLIIENSHFDWELTYEEIDYVIEGTLQITINGKTFTAYPGDVLFVPSGSKVVWGSPDRARVFYATYPANWADLL